MLHTLTTAFHAWRIARQVARDAARRRQRATRLAAVITHELGRLGFKKELKDGSRRVVQWRYPLLLTPDELYLRLDQSRFPDGKSTNDLRNPDVIKSLCDRCGSDVRVEELPTKEIAVVVRLAGATFPATFPISTFELPPAAPPLAVPLGVDAKGAHRWADLARLPHLLVVGPTGKGKSTFVHTMLTTWISRNTFEDIELWLADHKGGVELDRYRALLATPSRPGIVRRFSYKPADTIELLESALQTLEKRLDTLRQAGAADVDSYARQTGQRMRRIVVVIDEIFFLMLNKEKIDPKLGSGGKGFTISAWAEQLFSKIASAGRAPGVHLVIATQKTGKDVLTPLVTANFESRVVFGTADQYASIYLLNTAAALGLPRGRVQFRADGGELSEIQTPLITETQTKLIISRIARYGPDGGLGAADEARRFRDDAKLLVQVACDLFEGQFAIRKLFEAEGVRGILSRERIEEIGKRLESDGVLEAGGPRKPRRVARGYFQRVMLLDQLYGTESRPGTYLAPAGREPDVSPVPAPESHVLNTSEQQQDAEKPTSDDEGNTSYVRPESGTMSADPELPEGDAPAPPSWFLRTFEGAPAATPPPQDEPPAARRPRKVIAPRRGRR